MARILIPVRYAAWLTGELGTRIERTLRHGLNGLDAQVTRMPRGILVEADEAPGPFLEHVQQAVAELEQGVQEAYPMFHHQMGPLWTGTLQVLFPQPERAHA